MLAIAETLLFCGNMKSVPVILSPRYNTPYEASGFAICKRSTRALHQAQERWCRFMRTTVPINCIVYRSNTKWHHSHLQTLISRNRIFGDF
jgi:hypothetical protein